MHSVTATGGAQKAYDLLSFSSDEEQDCAAQPGQATRSANMTDRDLDGATTHSSGRGVFTVQGRGRSGTKKEEDESTIIEAEFERLYSDESEWLMRERMRRMGEVWDECQVAIKNLTEEVYEQSLSCVTMYVDRASSSYDWLSREMSCAWISLGASKSDAREWFRLLGERLKRRSHYFVVHLRSDSCPTLNYLMTELGRQVNPASRGSSNASYQDVIDAFSAYSEKEESVRQPTLVLLLEDLNFSDAVLHSFIRITHFYSQQIKIVFLADTEASPDLLVARLPKQLLGLLCVRNFYLEHSLQVIDRICRSVIAADRLPFHLDGEAYAWLLSGQEHKFYSVSAFVDKLKLLCWTFFYMCDLSWLSSSRRSKSILKQAVQVCPYALDKAVYQACVESPDCQSSAHLVLGPARQDALFSLICSWYKIFRKKKAAFSDALQCYSALLDAPLQSAVRPRRYDYLHLVTSPASYVRRAVDAQLDPHRDLTRTCQVLCFVTSQWSTILSSSKRLEVVRSLSYICSQIVQCDRRAPPVSISLIASNQLSVAQPPPSLLSLISDARTAVQAFLLEHCLADDSWPHNPVSRAFTFHHLQWLKARLDPDLSLSYSNAYARLVRDLR